MRGCLGTASHTGQQRPGGVLICINKRLGLRPFCSSWEVQALRSACLLQVLSATGFHISSFGAAWGIKHLALQIPNPHCGHISAAMSGLEQLETLWLATVDEMPIVTEALQLCALQSLRSLALASAVPESISCSDSCELHLDLDNKSMEHAAHPVWETVLPHLRSVALNGYSHELVVPPSVLLKAGNLCRADVTLRRCGTANAPLLLAGSLAHVDTLVISCGELHAIVPAHVTWRNVHMAAKDLNLRFEAVTSLGRLSRPSASASKTCRCATANLACTCHGHHNLSCTELPNVSAGHSSVQIGCCPGEEAPRLGWIHRRGWR